MAPKSSEGKHLAGSSSRFDTKRFKDLKSAKRFESKFKDGTVIFERIVEQNDLASTRFLHWLHRNRLMTHEF